MAMKGAKALEVWSRRACEGYPGVKIGNMSSSWRDGKAFCAVIHRYRPALIDWEEVARNDVKSNCTLAFTIAEKELDIPSLLDPQDMADCNTPDRLSILTYLSEFYHKFKDEKYPLGSPSTIILNTKKLTKSSSAASVLSPSKNNQVIVTSSTRDFVSNYLQGTAKMLYSVGNSMADTKEMKNSMVDTKEMKNSMVETKEMKDKVAETKEMKDKVEAAKKIDVDGQSSLSNFIGGVTGMICSVEKTLSSVENSSIDNDKKEEMPEQIRLDGEKLDNPHASIEKEPILRKDDAMDVAKLNEKNSDSETKADKISNNLTTEKDFSLNINGARKKESKNSHDNINNLVENSNLDKEIIDEVILKRDFETYGGDLKRKDSCDSGVSLSPLGSACNSPPTTRPDKSSNVAKAVELFKSQNEITFKGVTNLWRNKTQSTSIDQINSSSLMNKTEEKSIKVIHGTKEIAKDGDLKSDKDDNKALKDNVKSVKGGVILSVNNKATSNETAPLYNPKPYKPWGSNVLKMSQSFTNNKNKFISQTTLNSPDPVSLSSQGPASLSAHKSTPSLYVKNSSFGPTSLSIHNSPPNTTGSSSLFTQKSLVSNTGSSSLFTTQKSCPSLLIHKSSTGPTSLSIQNSPPFQSSFRKSYGGPASLLIHNSPPLPTSLPPGSASFSNQTSCQDQTSVIFCKSSSDTDNLSSDLEAVKIIDSSPDSPSPSCDIILTKTIESSPNHSVLSFNKISPDKSSLSIDTSTPDQSFVSINNSSSDQSFVSLNKASPDQPFLSFSNSYQDPPPLSSAYKSSYSNDNSSSEPSPSDLPSDSLDLQATEPASVSSDNSSPKLPFSSIHSNISEEKVEAKQSECDQQVNPNSTGPLFLNTPRHLFSSSKTPSGPKSLSYDQSAPPSGNKSPKCDKAAPKSMICDLSSPMSLGCDRPVTVDKAQPSAVAFKAAMRKFRSMTCISQVVHAHQETHSLSLSPTTAHFSAGQTKLSPSETHGQTEQATPSGRKDIPEYARWKVSSGCKPDRHRLNIESTAKPAPAINKTAANPAPAATKVTKDDDIYITAAPASSAVTKETGIAETRHDTITIIQNHHAIDLNVNSKQGGEVNETVVNDAGADITNGDIDITDGDNEGTGDEAGNKRWTDNAIIKQTGKPRLRKSVSLPHTIFHSEYVAGNHPFTITI